tara:strand:+ start:271 stop:498 length:228 start_codon:yes stop_codon:yes gene_type:complete
MGSRKDLKKYGIDTNYKGGDPAMDATIDAIKKDPLMKHMWGMGDRWKVEKPKTKKKGKKGKKSKQGKNKNKLYIA